MLTSNTKHAVRNAVPRGTSLDDWDVRFHAGSVEIRYCRELVGFIDDGALHAYRERLVPIPVAVLAHAIALDAARNERVR